MEMTRMKYVVLLVLLGGVGMTTLVAWSMLSRGFSALPEPTAVEVFVARRLRGLATPRTAREARNPVAADAEVLSDGMAHFADHCATCHANDGTGRTDIGRGLYPKPPDMRQSGTQQLTDGELAYIIHNGIRFTGMPAFGDEAGSAPGEDTWTLVHFIRHLPNITAEELESMTAMNPKSLIELEEEEAIRRFLEGEVSEPPELHAHD